MPVTTVRAMHHTSFTVSDLQRSLAFYRDLLGMEVYAEFERTPGSYVDRVIGIPNAHLKIALLRCPGTSDVLELIEYVQPRGPKVDVATPNTGSAHVCFVVDDAMAAYRALSEKGVRFRGEPVAITSGPHAGGYAIYFLDPDDITLELLQPGPRPGAG